MSRNCTKNTWMKTILKETEFLWLINIPFTQQRFELINKNVIISVIYLTGAYSDVVLFKTIS